MAVTARQLHEWAREYLREKHKEEEAQECKRKAADKIMQHLTAHGLDRWRDDTVQVKVVRQAWQDVDNAIKDDYPELVAPYLRERRREYPLIRRR